MKKKYCFGDTKIEVSLPEDIVIPENMKKFEIVQGNAEFTYGIKTTNNLKKIVDEFCADNKIDRQIERQNMIILLSGIKELRIIWIIGTNIPYAVTIEENDHETNVWIDEWIKEQMHSDTIFGSLLALEKKVIQKDCMILHSAFVCRNGEAILFTAPSGTGKSTQADLWTKYRETKTINGDRTLMKRTEHGWYACGWPICGSSEICHNECYPLKAIVVLSQSQKNHIEKMKGVGLVQKLVGEITVNMWNLDFQDHVLSLIEKLSNEIPVFHLECDISEEAVRCLEEVL